MISALPTLDTERHPVTRFPEHYPPQPSLATTVRQACVHSLIAILLVFMSTMLWAATFGDLPMSMETPQHCVRYDFGPATTADRLDR